MSSIVEKKAVAMAMIALGHVGKLRGLSSLQFKLLRVLRTGVRSDAASYHKKHPVTLPVLVKRGLVTVEDGYVEITPIGLLTLNRKEEMGEATRRHWRR